MLSKASTVLATLLAVLLAGVQSFTPDFPSFNDNNYDPRETTIRSTHHSLFTGLATCRHVVSSFLSRIEALNSHTNAIIALNPHALAQADVLDAQLRAGNASGLLFCIPVLLKDNFDTADMPTTGGCAALKDAQPTEDAPSVAALRDAGAIVLGKTNLHELALEGISVSSLGGQTVNPYDWARSSGGSGAAIAASFAVFATGSDTVNSLRSPASANALVSIRPTRGLLTRRGVIPISYTQDAIGPIGRSVRDVATALTVMASTGFDAADNATALVPEGVRGTRYDDRLSSSKLTGLRIGVLEGFFNRTSSAETTPVNDAMDHAQLQFERAGATIIPVNEAVYDAQVLLATLDTQRFEYRELLTAYLESASLGGSHPVSMPDLYLQHMNTSDFLVIPNQYEYVNTALHSSTSNKTYAAIISGVRNLTLTLAATFAEHRLDALIYPEQKNLVVPLGSPSQSGRNGILAALTGAPVVTLPVGYSPPTSSAPIGVPIGMEILGRPFSEAKLLKIAYAFETLYRWRRAPLWARESVAVNDYEEVPLLVPDRGNIPAEYPLGKL